MKNTLLHQQLECLIRDAYTRWMQIFLFGRVSANKDRGIILSPRVENHPGEFLVERRQEIDGMRGITGRKLEFLF